MASIKPEKGLRPMNVKRIIRRVTDNDYLFTIFTKILAVLIGLVASFYSNRFLGPQLKGELGRISSLLSIVAVTANFGLYQPYPYYKRQGEPDVLNKFLRIFLLQFIAYTVIGVIGAVCFHSFELTAVCLLAPIQVLANQLSFMMMVEDVKFKNAIFFTARIMSNTRSISTSVSDVVGSSMMISFASNSSARAISTICLYDASSARSGVFRSSDTCSRASTSAERAIIAPRSILPPRRISRPRKRFSYTFKSFTRFSSW